MSYKADKHDPFNPASPRTTMEEVDAMIYGTPDVPASGRIVAQPVPINDIWPDMQQPRRILPPDIRGDWNGEPVEVHHLLSNWHRLASELSGQRIEVVEYLMHHGDGKEEDESGHPVVDGYMALLALAAAIQRDGLLHPITVVNEAGRYIIETGERRWLAHHLLAYHKFEQFNNIPARVMDEFNVWRQAAENGRRQQLNAIGIARQIALLIMDMYLGDDGVDFDTLHQMVLPGEPDRKFYAQVASGNIWRIKRGFGQRILDVTGLSAMSQVRRYRALLTIPDEIWQQADIENWTEFHIRNHLNPAWQKRIEADEDKARKKLADDEKSGYTVSIDTVSPQNPPDSGDWHPFDPNETVTESQPFVPITDPVTGDGIVVDSWDDEMPEQGGDYDLISPEDQADYNPIMAEYEHGDYLWIVLVFLSQLEQAQDPSGTYTSNLCYNLMQLTPAHVKQMMIDQYKSTEAWNTWLDTAYSHLEATLDETVTRFLDHLDDFFTYLRELGAASFEDS